MKKIRGFKLNLRPKELQRRAKKAKLDLAALGLGEEAALAEYAARFAEASRPSALYESFPADSQLRLSPVPGLAYSLALVTLGPEADSFVELSARQRPEAAPLLPLLATLALEDASRFVFGLVEEEAKQEQCELSPIEYLKDPAALRSAVARLEGQKIGVSVLPDGLRPVHTVACGISWLSRTRSRAR